jgi:DNA ligase (NAD+)
VGEHVAELIAEHFDGLESIIRADERALVYQKAKKDQEESGIKGIGPEIAKSIVSYFEDESNKRRVERLLEAGIQFEKKNARSAAPSVVLGKSFVLTGTLATMTRSEAKELIQGKGGKVASSVSRRTDFLVKGDSAGTKLVKAEEMGVSILSEGAFVRLLGGGNG